MVLADQLNSERIRKATIVFVDDQPDSLSHITSQLELEGFQNIKTIPKLDALKVITDLNPAVLVLDLHGVAEHLDSKLHGLAVLDYVKRRIPFTRVIVYSGNDNLDVTSQEILAKADKRIKKGSISLKSIVCIVQEEAFNYFDPVIQRDVLTSKIGSDEIKKIGSFVNEYKFNRAFNKLKKLDSGDAQDSFLNTLIKLSKYGKNVVEIATLVKKLIEIVQT